MSISDNLDKTYKTQMAGRTIHLHTRRGRLPGKALRGRTQRRTNGSANSRQGELVAGVGDPLHEA